MCVHSYGLPWINEESLYQVTRHIFGKFFLKGGGRPLPPDPFTLVAQAKITDTSFVDMQQFDQVRSRNKSLSNAIGLWHQKVLGLSPYLEELGASGGGVDLRSISGHVDSCWGKPLYIEVKNRFNTIKASDEKELWEKLDFLARSNNAVAYLVQIIPESPVSYDRQWSPSGVYAKEIVRCCDGVTAYARAFDNDFALREIYLALPNILDDLAMELSLTIPGKLDFDAMRVLFDTIFPSTPAQRE